MAHLTHHCQAWTCCHATQTARQHLHIVPWTSFQLVLLLKRLHILLGTSPSTESCGFNLRRSWHCTPMPSHSVITRDMFIRKDEECHLLWLRFRINSCWISHSLSTASHFLLFVTRTALTLFIKFFSFPSELQSIFPSLFRVFPRRARVSQGNMI